MRGRLRILDQHGLKLKDIQEVIAGLRPLDGTKEFLDELRSLVQVIILSDTFRAVCDASPTSTRVAYAPLP